MEYLEIEGISIALDDEGYLEDLAQWQPAVAEYLAAQQGIELTDAHWEILYLLRDFYRRFEHSPAMRPLVKAVKLELGDEKGKSIYLMQLFPGNPAKLGALIAGLPKPDNCL